MSDLCGKHGPVTLSVVILARDEAAVLADTLQSVRPIADEILLLDTGSSDQTPQLARQHGARVVRVGWQRDFSAARNAGLRLAGGQWILWLDAGEHLSQEDARRLRRFVDHEADCRKAYLLLVRIAAPLADASAEQAAQARLMPKDPRIRFHGRVRESVRGSLQAAGIELDTLDILIHAHSRHHDLAWKTARAYAHLELAQLEAAGKTDCPARVWLAWGDACHDLGLFDQARQSFRRAIDTAGAGSSQQLEGYYGLISAFDSDPHFRSYALSVCLEALEAFPLDAQLLLAAGHYLEEQGQLELAARSFQTAWQHGQVDLETWHLADLHEVVGACWGLTLRALEKDEQAEKVFQDALDRYPNSVRLKRRLLDLYIHQGRCEPALALAEKLPVDQAERGPLADAVRGACKAARQEWTAALGYLQSAQLAGCRDPLCLRWLAVTLISNGRLREAEPVLRQWEAAEPHNVEPKRYLALLAGQPFQGMENVEQTTGTTALVDTAIAAAGCQTPAAEVWRSESSLGPIFRVDPAATQVVAPPQFPLSQTVSFVGPPPWPTVPGRTDG